MKAMAAAILLMMAMSATADEFTGLKQILTERMPQTAIGELSAVQGTDFIEVQINGRDLIYTNRDGSVAFVGTMYDLKTRANLTESRKADLSWIDFATLPLDKAIVKVKGNGSRKLAVFTDPDCPYCKRLESELSAVTDATIYVFLYPLVDLHPDAARKARLVWCAADRGKAWDELMSAGIEPPAAAGSCEDPLGDISVVAKRLWITGTPGLVFGNGRVVPGLISHDQIEQHLVEAPRS
jgi:thiol:disulfide interchange protein DsbC